MAREYSPHEQLWSVHRWPTHGIERVEYIGPGNVTIFVIVQLDDGAKVNHPRNNIYLTRKRAIKRCLNEMQAQFAALSGERKVHESRINSTPGSIEAIRAATEKRCAKLQENSDASQAIVDAYPAKVAALEALRTQLETEALG